MARLLLFAALGWLLPAFGQGETAQSTLAGKVELVEGDVRFFDRNRQLRRPALDDTVYEGDSIVTGADGEVHVRLEDGGLIAVRPGTKMRISAFRALGDDNDRLTIGLLEGSFRSITGWIASFNRANYAIHTPTATIGVRGTDHEPFHIPEGSSLGEPGTYDKVNQGGTYLETKQGRVEVEPGRAGFAHLKRAERPRVLEQVPGHFRATRHEQRIAQRYQEIQKRLPQLREERRTKLQERKAERKKAQELRREKHERPQKHERLQKHERPEKHGKQRD
jgi:FecR-like protein